MAKYVLLNSFHFSVAPYVLDFINSQGFTSRMYFHYLKTLTCIFNLFGFTVQRKVDQGIFNLKGSNQ